MRLCCRQRPSQPHHMLLLITRYINAFPLSSLSLRVLLTVPIVQGWLSIMKTDRYLVFLLWAGWFSFRNVSSKWK
jgi:hypothetical protein